MKHTATVALPKLTLFHENDPAKAEVSAFASGQVVAFSTRQPDKETPSEDLAALIPIDASRGVLVVADGLGGLPAGDQASRVAIEQLARSLAEVEDDSQSLRTAILNGFEAANQAVLELSLGAATTMAAVEIQPGSVRPYHAGDSMILVVGQRGRTKHHTVAHSPIGYAVEAGFLDSEEAMHHEERHLISNMIGSAEMHITIGPAIELAPRDTVLLATDGLADNLHLEEIVDRIRKGPLRQVCESLSQDCLERMTTPAADHPSKPDDCTAIVYRPNYPPPASSGP